MTDGASFEKAWNITKEDNPLPPDQRIVDMANAANNWGSVLAYEDHHETVFDDYTSDLPPIYDRHEGRHPYWEAKEQAEQLHEKIWQAGLAALGLKPSEMTYPDDLPYMSEFYSDPERGLDMALRWDKIRQDKGYTPSKRGIRDE